MNSAARSLLLFLLLEWTGIVFALPSIGSVVSYVNDFGHPASSNNLASVSQYLDTSIDIVQKNSSLTTTSPSSVIFSQNAAALSGGLPPALGKFLAVRAQDNMVAVFSGLAAISTAFINGSSESGVNLGELAARGNDSFGYRLRLYDEAKTTWVNPLLLMQLPMDSIPPRIESMVLRRGKASVDFLASSKGRINLSQGTYAIFVRAAETGKGSASSGLFRYRVLLDGQVILDKKMDSAQAMGNGLAFMGLPPPSSSNVDENERLGLGNLDLPRGQHLFEIYVFDFSGNQTQTAWRLNAE
jgi:hypothetical protein